MRKQFSWSKIINCDQRTECPVNFEVDAQLVNCLIVIKNVLFIFYMQNYKIFELPLYQKYFAKTKQNKTYKYNFFI